MRRLVLPARKCDQCGAEYLPAHPSQRFCGKKCGQRHAYEERRAVLDAYRAGKLKIVDDTTKEITP